MWFAIRCGEDDEIVELDAKLGQERGHVALLLGHIRAARFRLYEYAQLALTPVLALLEQIGQENGQTAVVEHPPHVHVARLVFSMKHIQALESARIDFGVAQLDHVRAFEKRATPCAIRRAHVRATQEAFLQIQVARILIYHIERLLLVTVVVRFRLFLIAYMICLMQNEMFDVFSSLEHWLV